LKENVNIKAHSDIGSFPYTTYSQFSCSPAKIVLLTPLYVTSYKEG